MASPRIIAGSAKGIRLKSVPGFVTRPITDRAKEALFNIIGPDVINSKWLDLFAGTGSVGLEALSRGAEFVRFIEINHSVVRVLQENIIKCGFDSKSELIKTDAYRYLSNPQDCRFDYIFIAPPQYKEIWVKILRTLDTNVTHLENNAWLIVQIDPLEFNQIVLINFNLVDKRKYGNTLFLFFELLSK